jgi:hypothetical protein
MAAIADSQVLFSWRHLGWCRNKMGKRVKVTTKFVRENIASHAAVRFEERFRASWT